MSVSGVVQINKGYFSNTGHIWDDDINPRMHYDLTTNDHIRGMANTTSARKHSFEGSIPISRTTTIVPFLYLLAKKDWDLPSLHSWLRPPLTLGIVLGFIEVFFFCVVCLSLCAFK